MEEKSSIWLNIYIYVQRPWKLEWCLVNIKHCLPSQQIKTFLMELHNKITILYFQILDLSGPIGRPLSAVWPVVAGADSLCPGCVGTPGMMMCWSPCSSPLLLSDHSIVDSDLCDESQRPRGRDTVECGHQHCGDSGDTNMQPGPRWGIDHLSSSVFHFGFCLLDSVNYNIML